MESRILKGKKKQNKLHSEWQRDGLPPSHSPNYQLLWSQLCFLKDYPLEAKIAYKNWKYWVFKFSWSD